MRGESNLSQVTTFAKQDSYEEAVGRCRALSVDFLTVSPEPGFREVGIPALALSDRGRSVLAADMGTRLMCSGWVEFRRPAIAPPPSEPLGFEEDVFGRAAVMVLAPCMADATRIRIIAHISGDLTEALPYMNSTMKEACYNKDGPTFTYQDGYRMVSVNPRRIAVAKADEILDAWRVLEDLRIRANEAWSRRMEIAPSFEMRGKPPALEILKRLPRTNCRACGERTCLAFAVRVRAGEVPVQRCAPVFETGEYGRLRDALAEIAGGFGAAPGRPGTTGGIP